MHIIILGLDYRYTPSLIQETVQQFSKADTNNFSLNWKAKKG
jgi:hypothetical protein